MFVLAVGNTEHSYNFFLNKSIPNECIGLTNTHTGRLVINEISSQKLLCDALPKSVKRERNTQCFSFFSGKRVAQSGSRSCHAYSDGEDLMCQLL